MQKTWRAPQARAEFFSPPHFLGRSYASVMFMMDVNCVNDTLASHAHIAISRRIKYGEYVLKLYQALNARVCLGHQPMEVSTILVVSRQLRRHIVQVFASVEAYTNCDRRLYFKPTARGIGYSFQLAITTSRINLIDYGTATAQS